MKHSQYLDIEIFLIRIFGCVDIATGYLIGVYWTNIEDTGSLEKGLGKDSAASRFHIPWNVQ